LSEEIISKDENFHSVTVKTKTKRRSPLQIITLIMKNLPIGKTNAVSLSELSRIIKVDVTTISNYLKVIELINSFPNIKTFKKPIRYSVKKNGKYEPRIRETVSVWLE